MFGELNCGSVHVGTAADGTSLATGFVGTQAELDRVNGLLDGQVEDNQVVLAPWPKCEVMLTLEAQLNDSDTPQVVIDPEAPQIGDELKVGIRTPGFASYIYAAYFAADGSVINLSQPNSTSLKPKAGHETLTIASIDGQGLTVQPPVGDEMLLVLASESPLFDAARPGAELDRQFLSGLREAVLRGDAGRVTATLLAGDDDRISGRPLQLRGPLRSAQRALSFVRLARPGKWPHFGRTLSLSRATSVSLAGGLLMPHDTPLITTIVAGLVLAFIFGAIANRLRMPTLVGYLIAGIVVGPYTPGMVADAEIAAELSEIGVILLMFGVGLNFSLDDLLHVGGVAVPGALLRILGGTGLGVGLALLMGWGWGAGIVFGLALSVASTVVLLKTLQDRHLIETDRGRIAVGWVIVEDIAMVLALVLDPGLCDAAGRDHGRAARSLRCRSSSG